MIRGRTEMWGPILGLGALLLPACADRAQPPRPERGPATESTASAIFGGGKMASPCQFPSTVLLSGCTGTLVHPQIIVTAAHCGIKHKTATFGEASAGARKVPIESCKTMGNGDNAADDYAYCKLVTPVTDVPIAPPLMGCEIDQLKPGRTFMMAGFGDADDNGNGFGRKRWLEAIFNKIERGAANVAGKGVGYCYGDSGGPAFVKLTDGSWRTFGIDSEGRGSSCGAGDLMAFVHTAVPWIEKNSGVDITPCHDADGTWNPGPNCRGFAMNLELEGRSWSNGCAEPALSPPAATCGAAYAGAAGDAGVTPPSSSDAGNGDGGGDGPSGSGGHVGDGGGPGSGGAGGNGGAPTPDAQPGSEPSGGSRSGGAPGTGAGPGSGDPLGSGGRGADPGASTTPTSGGQNPSGGCSMGGARAETGTAVLAAIAFALAFILRRRWFPRARVVDPRPCAHAGRHAD